jgi:hypothetical protein
LTTRAERARQGVLADLAAVIEQAAADLALAEEPAGFPAALEAGAAPEPDPPPAESPARG